MIADSVDAFTSSGKWPADVGAKAYVDALEWGAEGLALKRAVDLSEDLAHDTRELLSDDALAHLGTRLADVLGAARKAAEVLGDVRSADDAIKAGGDAVSAWSDLSSLLAEYTNIRAAQWAFLTPQRHRLDVAGIDDEDARKLRQWKRDGHGHVMGYNPDDVTEFVRIAMQTARYSVDYLRWAAAIGTAFVPASRDDLASEVEASRSLREPAVYDDNGPMRMRDLSPRVDAPLMYQTAVIPTHASAPQLCDSGPAARVTTNTTTIPDERLQRSL
ncbi:hypothetical protein [Streptomyces sp. NPDC005125]